MKRREFIAVLAASVTAIAATGCSPASERRMKDVLGQDIDDESRADFAAGRTRIVEGWILSETEARDIERRRRS